LRIERGAGDTKDVVELHGLLLSAHGFTKTANAVF
jgi:hypothetical protein